MPKIPECDRCLLYARNPHLVCAVHPAGPNTNTCLDFRADPNAAAEELWEPEGANYYNGELILQPKQRWTRLATVRAAGHAPTIYRPVRCPRCEMTYPKYDTPLFIGIVQLAGGWMIRCEAVVRSGIFKLSQTGKHSLDTPLGNAARQSPSKYYKRALRPHT
jgi:hypothetical protein